MTAEPIVASYCTTFLKPEMRHIYRQVTGLRRYRTFVMTRERLEEAKVGSCDAFLSCLSHHATTRYMSLVSLLLLLHQFRT